MQKRKVARGIIIYNDKIVLLKRIRKEGEKYLHYYAIPGGGIEANETKEEACIREVLEEVSLNVEIDTYLGMEEYDKGICYYYKVNYLSGNPKLGGEEALKNNKDNYYEVCLIPKEEISILTIPGCGVEMIKKAIKN